MKKLFVLLILHSTMALGQSEIRNFRVETFYENWEIDQPSYIAGNYYRLSFLERDPSVSGFNLHDLSISEANMIYGFLLAKGIKIEESWFKEGSGSCGVLDVVVFPYLCIRTASDKHEIYLKELGFYNIEQLPMDSCPGSVKHSVFHYDE